MGTTGDQGAPTRIPKDTVGFHPILSKEVEPRSDCSPGQRGTRSNRERSNRVSGPGGFYSPLFVVPKKDGGWRPIINLKRLNQFLCTTHFKMESILSLRDVLKKDDYMIKVDLKDAYLTVPIHAPHRKYLRFLWNGTSYQFKVLPFGLSTAPWTFTKIMRPVMAKLREQGLRLIIYLDDILLMADSPEKLQYHTHILINLLQDLGFILNTKKCSLEPSQVIEFLSFLVDSRIMKLFLPQEKVDQIKKECRSMLKKGHSSARGLAHLIGLLTATIHACLPAPLHYRGLQRLKHRALSTTQPYDQQVDLDMDAIKDLQFWITEIHKWNGRPINLPTADLTITSDASTSGWGASCGTSQTGGPMDCGGGPSTYQPLGVESSLPSPSDVCIQTEQPTHPALDQQSHCHSLPESQGWHNIKSNIQPGGGDLGMVSAEESDNPCRTHSGEAKQSSRCRISSEFRFQ